VSDVSATDTTTEPRHPPVTFEEPAVPATGPEPAPVAPRRRRSVAVPVWLLVVALGAIVVVGAFFVGRSTADTTEGPDTLADAVQQTARGDMPMGNFDTDALIQALRQNPELNLGILGDLLERGSR
jgi:hypothetical protein